MVFIDMRTVYDKISDVSTPVLSQVPVSLLVLAPMHGYFAYCIRVYVNSESNVDTCMHDFTIGKIRIFSRWTRKKVKTKGIRKTRLKYLRIDDLSIVKL